jgi:hypothetical protein
MTIMIMTERFLKEVHLNIIALMIIVLRAISFTSDGLLVFLTNLMMVAKA